MSIKQVIKRIIMVFHKPLYQLHHTRIDSTSYVANGTNIIFSHIGKYCFINRYCNLNHVAIGNYSSIGPFVLIGGEEHSVDFISTSNQLSDRGISDRITEIGHDVWIGTQACIKQGVKIGNGAVIGANSFVNKDVPPFAIAVGSPAKVIRYRFKDELIAEIEKSQYWNYPPQEAKLIIEKIENKIQ